MCLPYDYSDTLVSVEINFYFLTACASCLMNAILWLGSCTILTIPFTQGKLHLCCTCRGGQANTGDSNKAKYTCVFHLQKQKARACKLTSPSIRKSDFHRILRELLECFGRGVGWAFWFIFCFRATRQIFLWGRITVIYKTNLTNV